MEWKTVVDSKDGACMLTFRGKGDEYGGFGYFVDSLVREKRGICEQWSDI